MAVKFLSPEIDPLGRKKDKEVVPLIRTQNIESPMVVRSCFGLDSNLLSPKKIDSLEDS